MNCTFARPAATLIVFLAGAGLVRQSCKADDAIVRIWKDSSGKYRVEAGFVNYENGSVQLQKSDGVNLLVPFKRLSSPDQTYVRIRLRQRQIGDRKKALPNSGLRTETTTPAQVNAKTLYGINWCPTDKVHVIAAGKVPKPVIWFRVLGALDGFM